MVLHLNKLEFPSSTDALCQVWLKLAKGFWRRRYWNFVNVFSLFRNYLPLEKGVALHLYKLEFPSSNNTLWQVWLKKPSGCKCEKFMDRRTDDRRQAIRKTHLSFQSRWAKKENHKHIQTLISMLCEILLVYATRLKLIFTLSIVIISVDLYNDYFIYAIWFIYWISNSYLRTNCRVNIWVNLSYNFLHRVSF